MKIKRMGDTLIIADEVKVAETFLDRLVGLMFKSEMVGFNALLIKDCRSIHTFFMKYDIDVVFLDREMKVKKIIRKMRPWRMSWIYFTSSQVLEMRAGELSVELSEGDKLEVVCTN